jgi:hypothetical protein
LHGTSRNIVSKTPLLLHAYPLPWELVCSRSLPSDVSARYNICLYIYQCMYLFICQYICIYIFLYFLLSISLPKKRYIFICLHIYLAVVLCIYLSAYLSLYLTQISELLIIQTNTKKTVK